MHIFKFMVFCQVQIQRRMYICCKFRLQFSISTDHGLDPTCHGFKLTCEASNPQIPPGFSQVDVWTDTCLNRQVNRQARDRTSANFFTRWPNPSRAPS